MSAPLSAEELKNLPQAQCYLPIYLVPMELSLEEMVAHLIKEPILGFDTETKPAFKAGQSYAPALVQLATDRAAYVIQVKMLKDLDLLLELLNAPNLKVGVGVTEDLRRLGAYFRVTLNPKKPQFVDLTPMAKAKGIPTGSLRGLAAELLQKRVSKGAQLTNWAMPHLTHSQLKYAALDAVISREIYLKLKARNI